MPIATSFVEVLRRPVESAQYAGGAYVDQLAMIKATPSMSRTGNCYDNAPMESFFHTMKVELVHQCRWATHAKARQPLFGYIEGYYNWYRMPSALGYLTPEQAEQRMTG
jgi:putative transposase